MSCKTQKKKNNSPIVKAKSLLSNGEEERAFVVLKEAAERKDVMACYDCGFMMIQGIGCERDWEGGLKMIGKGRKLEKKSDNMSWKSNGSVTELLGPQSMNMKCLFLVFLCALFE